MITIKLSEISKIVLLENISWQTYECFLKDFEEQPGMRLAYNRGWLEIIAPLDLHETYKQLIVRFIHTLTEELNIEIRSLGSMTCKRKDLQCGIDPDECFYIQNEQIIRYLEKLDINQAPSPDLAIEIDITSSSINRLDIYAALGVPEVWRYDGNRLIILRLEDGEYKECEISPTLPQLLPSEVMRFLELSKTMGETSLIKMCREWVRSQVKEEKRS